MSVNFNLRGIWWRHYIPMLILFGVAIVPQTQQFFSSMGWRWAYILFLSFVLSFCLTPVFRWIAYRFGILDRPDARKLHQEATPLLGGASVFISFLAAITINGIFSLKLGAMMIGSAALFVIGIADDIKEIPAGLKLTTQIVFTIFVMSCGIVLRVVPESLGIFSETGNVLLTLFWIIGITNAMNFFDGMDGMAAGLGAIISFFLGVVAFQTTQPFLGWIAVAMMGSCIGFLPYNLMKKGKATIFLGDAGSTVIGFILSCVAVYGDWAEGNPVVALASPLLIFWVLIFDMVYITIDRILTGKVANLRQWIEYVGKDHLHHRLAYILGGHKRSVFFIYLLSLCLGISAVVLRNARPLDALLLLVQAVILVVLITILEKRGRLFAGDKNAYRQKETDRSA
jgi:UDP-GlcNAc:undecaprenyl-phosphate GlcNAc-1-phosphate transferase